MGTDIHAVFERYDSESGKWEVVETPYEENRHYQLFAWLADVRNGYGFAGVKTGEPITPLQSERGWPDDFSPPEGEYMGDHSFGWLHLDEILGTSAGVARKCGVVEIDHYRQIDGGAPNYWAGDVSGRFVVVSDPGGITENTTHVRMEWDSELSKEFHYFLDICRDLKEKYVDVRMVFGFDS